MKKDIQVKNKCIECGCEFKSNSIRSKFCSINCKTEYRRINRLLKGFKDYDYIICKWDGKPVGKYMSEHIDKFYPSKTIKEYQLEFPDALIIAPAYLEKISKNSGKHMKTDKYKKMFSEKFKGVNNPNHSSNTTKLQRQLVSKYSKEYWKANFPELTENEIELKVSNFAHNSQKNRLTETQLEYWVKRCDGNLEEAKEKLKERQTTFSKEKLIKKYGEVEGLKKWSDRQKRWKDKVFNDKQWLGGGVSKVSNDLFEKIIKLNKLKQGDFLYGIKNEKFISNKDLHYKYDFTYLPTKKIIEFHGDYWHCNPILYESNYYHKIKNMSAKEIWDYDEEKNELAKKHGYSILVIWEYDYRKNPEQTIKKCVEFLND